jgi:hypothetical protein
MPVPTTVPTYSPDSPQTDAGPADDAGCPACPHPLPEHDPIAARFCRATAAGTLSRGCVCRG